MEPKEAVLESKIDYVQMGINGKLELVCAYKYGYYEQVMTQLACSEEKGDALIIWTNLGFIDLPIQSDEQYWCKSMLSKLNNFLKPLLQKYLQDTWKNSWTRSSLRILTLTNFDETIEEKKEDLDDSLSLIVG